MRGSSRRRCARTAWRHSARGPSCPSSGRAMTARRWRRCWRICGRAARARGGGGHRHARYGGDPAGRKPGLCARTRERWCASCAGAGPTSTSIARRCEADALRPNAALSAGTGERSVSVPKGADVMIRRPFSPRWDCLRGFGRRAGSRPSSTAGAGAGPVARLVAGRRAARATSAISSSTRTACLSARPGLRAAERDELRGRQNDDDRPMQLGVGRTTAIYKIAGRRDAAAVVGGLRRGLRRGSRRTGRAAVQRVKDGHVVIDEAGAPANPSAETPSMAPLSAARRRGGGGRGGRGAERGVGVVEGQASVRRAASVTFDLERPVPHVFRGPFGEAPYSQAMRCRSHARAATGW